MVKGSFFYLFWCRTPSVGGIIADFRGIIGRIGGISSKSCGMFVKLGGIIKRKKLLKRGFQ
ncbi:hypothetical protein CHR53_23915 [Neobacillus mesonae]|uniref:Uncharacterized protein n=1 Tax=Neobacillus mesonae TaxID=1193713 RepID=A0A3Q9QXS6_9BACI|nr:hypothetical protein CHR53_23915 [Neobacillus mesonae]